MGYMRHNAIVVTGSDFNDHLQNAHAFAVTLGASVSAITDTVTNGYRSFLFAPDGSKEGWTESCDGDARREKFIEALRHDTTMDGLDWVEVQYGDDGHVTTIVHDSDEWARDPQ